MAVVILTFNEEANLPAALASVLGWANEVFVVDSYSTDRTVDSALQAAADVRIVQHHFESYSRQWKWALESLPIRSEWTLKLDADERVTGEFKREVDVLLSQAPPALDGIYFRRRIHMVGEWIRWGGVRSNYDLRMWRTGRARFEDRPVNEHALVQGRTTRLKAFVDHYDAKSLTEWIDKQNRYTSLETVQRIEGNLTGEVRPRLFGTPIQRRMWLKMVYLRLPARPVFFFLFRVVGQLGVLDGWAGARHALLESFFLYIQELKYLEWQRRGIPPTVAWPARGTAHPALPAEDTENAAVRAKKLEMKDGIR